MKKIIFFVIVLFVAFSGVCYAQEQTLTYNLSDMFDMYRDKGAYAEAVYDGNLSSTECVDVMEDLYANGYSYENFYQNRLMFTREEVIKTFGVDSDEYKAFEKSGLEYFVTNRDNAFRHEKDVTDANGIKKGAWFVHNYYKYSSNSQIMGSVSLGIDKGNNISKDDNKITFVIEYLDNHTDDIYLQYINTDWTGNGYSGDMFTIYRENTGLWRTAVVTVDNARLAPKSDSGNTGIASGKEDIILKSTNAYISRVMVIDGSYVDSNISAKHEAIPCPKKTYTDSYGNTYYFMLAPGMRAINPYVTQQNWSNDGTKFVFGNDNDRMYEYDIKNETLRFLDYAETGSSLNATVTPDNHIYYTYNQTLYRINWDTYQRERVCQFPSGTKSVSVQITNDGKYMNGYYYGKSVGGKLIRLDTQNGVFDKAFGKNFSRENPYSQDVGHPIINPVYPDVLFFCNEGPTQYIPDRLWMVDANTGLFTNIFRQSYNEGGLTAETSGHEVWSMNGEYLYFVKYAYNQNKGQNGIVRVLFEDGKFTGEREYLNGDASYWHCYPSGDDNWVAADTMSGKIYLISNKNHTSKMIAAIEQISCINPETGNMMYYDHPYSPHPHISFNNTGVNWQMAIQNNPDLLGVAWADISGYTQNTDYTENIYYPGTDGHVISYNNTKSQSFEKQIEGKTFVCADNGNNVYYNIDDNIIKNINVPVRLTFTAFSDFDDKITIGYTSGVKDEYNFHKYQDKKIVLDAKKGINTYTVDMGYINAFNVCDYRSDMYFYAQNGTVCVADIRVSTYDETFDIYTKDAIYSLSANGDDETYGMYTLNGNESLIDINDKQSILDMGVSENSYELAKNAGYKYVTYSSDGSWNYETVADLDGITKNAWFITKHARFINGEPRELGGFIYFGVSNDVITADDNELIVTVEYLDNRTAPFYFKYLTGKNTYANYKIIPQNTGKWTTVTFTLNNAVISSTNSGSRLASGKEDMRLEAQGADLYVSKLVIQKADKKVITDVAVSNQKAIVSVANNTISDSDVRLYTGVYDTDGKLIRIYTSGSTTIGSMNTVELSNNITVNNGESVKNFVLQNNAIPYLLPHNPMRLSVTVSNGNAKLLWNGFKDKDDVVYYKIYGDGDCIATVTDTTYTTDNIYSSYMIKAVDLYGKQLEKSYNYQIEFK